MKKILIGMSGIVATLALVGGVAYAVAFGHVEATATATTTNDLLIFDDATSSYKSVTDLSGNAFSGLTTVGNHKQLFFKNQTGAPTTALTAHQQGTLGGDPGVPDKVQVAFVDGTSTTTPNNSFFHTLNEWTTANGGTGYPIAGVVIPANTADHPVMMFVRLDPTLTSTSTSYSVTGIDFDFGPTY